MRWLALIVVVHVVLMLAMTGVVQWAADRQLREKPGRQLSKQWSREYHTLLGIAAILPELLVIAGAAWYAGAAWRGLRKAVRRG